MARSTSSGRRRPVPREWREEHHSLDVRSHIAGGGWGGWDRTYRARGRCACGVEFNPSRNPDGTPTNANYMTREDVIEAWKDHVEDAYYAERES